MRHGSDAAGALLTKLPGAGAPGVIVEKPVCIAADDYKTLRKLDAETKTKIAVNHQLRHYPMIIDFLEDVEDGKIAEVRCIDATARLPMAGQGCHVLDLRFAFNGYAQPKSVFGASSEYDDINGTHPAPSPRNHSSRSETAWERSRPDDTIEQGQMVYGDEDAIGQANYTNAMFDWLEDDAKPHPCSLATSLDEWLLILAGYLSTVEARAVEMPFNQPNDLLDQYKQFIGVE